MQPTFRTLTARRVFLVLTLLLLISDALFVLINKRADEAQLHLQLDAESDHLRRMFESQLTSTATRMQQTAAYIAMDRDVQQLFMQGRNAAEAEGGGAGGERAAAARQALLQRLQEPWQRMREEYDTRQLHFQFGEQAISFLRLHAPQLYGDPLDSVRFVIRDAIRLRAPTMGFESGRIVSGIRGVVPVYAQRPGQAEKSFVGVLEAGTSFTVMREQLEAASDTHLAVLLHRQHLEEVLFPKQLQIAQASGNFAGDWFIESAGEPELPALLALPEVRWSLAHNDVAIINGSSPPIAVFSFPLRDYLGALESARPAVGAVLLWRSIEGEMSQLHDTLKTNLLYALVAFLLIEALFYLGIRLVTYRLNAVIVRQTDELREQAIHDRLTGLYNRYHLDEAFARECARAQRYGEPLSLAILDLDHFKRINDEHGHLRGDHVLTDFAYLIGRHLRAADLLFRYGGEEFLILLSNTGEQSAHEACEHLRTTLMESCLAGLPQGAITVSIGMTTMRAEEPCDLSALLHRADSALYRAKEQGRNRVEAG